MSITTTRPIHTYMWIWRDFFLNTVITGKLLLSPTSTQRCAPVSVRVHPPLAPASVCNLVLLLFLCLFVFFFLLKIIVFMFLTIFSSHCLSSAWCCHMMSSLWANNSMFIQWFSGQLGGLDQNFDESFFLPNWWVYHLHYCCV